MSSRYFENFPSVTYNNSLAKNITVRARILSQLKISAINFYPYVIKDGQTAEGLAYDYYGNPNYNWIIYYSNDIIDPYFDWPLSTPEFEKFISKKYESYPGYNDCIIQAKETTAYYKKIAKEYYLNNFSNALKMSSDYTLATDGYDWTKITVDEDIKISSVLTPDPAIWQEIDVYTHESDLNDKKRYIQLLDRTYTSIIEKQLREIVNA